MVSYVILFLLLQAALQSLLHPRTEAQQCQHLNDSILPFLKKKLL